MTHLVHCRYLTSEPVTQTNLPIGRDFTITYFMMAETHRRIRMQTGPGTWYAYYVALC